MRYLFLSILFFLSACNTDDDILLDCSENCSYINPISFTIESRANAILLNFGSSGHIDGSGESCPPDAFEIFMSEENGEFEKIITIKTSSGTHLVENLEDGKEYAFKLIASHCELGEVTAPTRKTTAGVIPLPEFIENPLSSSNFEDFRLAPDGDRFIYHSSSDKWYQSSFSNPVQGVQVFSDVSNAQWSQSSQDQIVGVERTLIPILPNLNGLTSKTLISKNLANETEDVLHEIENPWNFQNDEHNPDLYWIHEFHFSLDGKSIYFQTNRENGSTNVRDQKVFNNIWKLDLATKIIEPLSDFLTLGFKLRDFREDPKQLGNFYLLGGNDGDKVEFEGSYFSKDRVDIYYYNATSQSLTEVLITDEEESSLNIDPSGEYLVFATDRTGLSDLTSYNLVSQQYKQITFSRSYVTFSKWQHLNWISDNEFMCYVRENGTNKFAVFSL